MRVALVTETWRPGLDGVVTRLGHTVGELVSRGHEVLVVAPTQGPPSPGVVQVRTRGVVVPFIDPHRRWGLPDGRVPALVERFAADVVHVVNPALMGTWAVRRLAGGRPLVVSLHTDLAAYASRYHLGFTRPLLRRLNEAAYRQADLALATSPRGLDLLAELRVPNASIWPAAVDRELFTDDASGPRPARTDGDDGPLEVVCVGRLAREKGYDVLRPVLGAGLPGPALHLTFVGEGPDQARLRRVFAGTPTTFAGRLTGRPLADAYRSADVVAFTSTTETVGLVLLEAAALDRPVVAVDTRATRDALAHHPRARLVPPGASAGQWRAALTAARASTASPRDGSDERAPLLSWAAATDVLLAAYASVRDRRAAQASASSR